MNLRKRIGIKRNTMSPIAQFDQEMDKLIQELAMRIVVPLINDFDDVWEVANRVCDRYLAVKAA